MSEIHLFTSLTDSGTKCGQPGEYMSDHEIKRGRITCGPCLQRHAEELEEQRLYCIRRGQMFGKTAYLVISNSNGMCLGYRRSMRAAHELRRRITKETDEDDNERFLRRLRQRR